MSKILVDLEAIFSKINYKLESKTSEINKSSKFQLELIRKKYSLDLVNHIHFLNQAREGFLKRSIDNRNQHLDAINELIYTDYLELKTNISFNQLKDLLVVNFKEIKKSFLTFNSCSCNSYDFVLNNPKFNSTFDLVHFLKYKNLFVTKIEYDLKELGDLCIKQINNDRYFLCLSENKIFLLVKLYKKKSFRMVILNADGAISSSKDIIINYEQIRIFKTTSSAIIHLNHECTNGSISSVINVYNFRLESIYSLCFGNKFYVDNLGCGNEFAVCDSEGISVFKIENFEKVGKETYNNKQNEIYSDSDKFINLDEFNFYFYDLSLFNFYIINRKNMLKKVIKFEYCFYLNDTIFDNNFKIYIINIDKRQFNVYSHEGTLLKTIEINHKFNICLLKSIYLTHFNTVIYDCRIDQNKIKYCEF